MTINEFKDTMYRIQGKTIAVVYIFEGEESKGFEHYDIWKSDVISEWLGAIQHIHCRPLIIDVRTFIQKAMNYSLPHVDFVLNLNAGNKELSTLGLIPSICSFLNIPCIPCNTVSIITGEHKEISNYIAQSVSLNIPNNSSDPSRSIFRPINYGSSRGVIKGKADNNDIGISQEFIKGYDITTPIIYNPLEDKLQVLPTIMYYSEDKDIEWYFNEDVKEKRGGYKKKVLRIDELTTNKYIELANKLGIKCYCRIDARIMCTSSDEWDNICTKPVPFEQIYFIEINPMPTLKQNINIHNSIDALTEGDAFFSCYYEYNSFYNNVSQTGFLLLCSIIANSKPSVEEKRI